MSPSVIRIKPIPEIECSCPKCSKAANVLEVSFHSAFVLARCTCTDCDSDFYQTLPTGHTVINTLTFDKASGELARHTGKSWLSEALLNTLRNERSGKVEIKKLIYREHSCVVVLNALDFLYGHVLLKLFNAAYHLDRDENTGLVLIIPKMFEWLVPKGCAEVWIVDLTLTELSYGHTALRQFISEELGRFETVYASKAFSHPDFTSFDTTRFTGISPFDLKTFTSTPPTITFVLRGDRWWLEGRFAYWFYRLCRKLKVLQFGSQILSSRQNRLVKQTISFIRKKYRNASFHIAGLGSIGTFEGYALDERMDAPDDSRERSWCKTYAQSHLVIGVHGSNMLLPTAHSAGCIEILPEDRYGNIVQDISVRYTDRRQLYFYRFAHQYASPRSIANIAISVIENFDVFEKNMCRNIYREPAYEPQIVRHGTIFASHPDDGHR